MKDFLSKYATTEGLLFALGFLWFVVSSIIPAIPQAIPLPPIVPGLQDVTPGLLIAVGLVPVIIKVAVPGTVPFVHGSRTTEVKPDA